MKNFLIIKIVAFLGYLLSVVFLFGCSNPEQARDPVIQPKKEATWVRTEKVQKTKQELLSSKKEKLAEIPINSSLVEKITSPKGGLVATANKFSCLTRSGSLDFIRTRVQKSGGMWSAFERNLDSKPYSFYGMQLDSNINKLVFSLSYLCQTSEGVPLNKVAVEFKKLMQDYGREETIKILISQGEHLDDIERFLNYEEFARKIRERKVDLKQINPRLDQAELLVGLYEELSNMPIDEKSIDIFLSNSVTLLKVMKEFIETDHLMVMSLNEDGLVPYHHIDQDM
jgi:hypothetical protein